MKQRRKNAFFQDLLEAGSRTTYHGKIRGRSSGRPRATVSRGKQRTYKGVQIIPLGGGEYTISIDRDSRFENVRDAKKVIDHIKANPSKPKFWVIVDPNGGMVGHTFATKAAAERQAKRYREQGYHNLTVSPWFSNPRGSKGKFQRCVESVAARGGAYDPRAVCGAMEKRLRGNPVSKIYVSPSGRFKGRWEVGVPGYPVQTKKSKRGAVSLAKRIQAQEGGEIIERDVPAEIRPAPAWMRNPAAGAIAVSEEFHGRKVKQMVPVQETRHYHKYLADLGELRKLVVLTRDGKGKVTLTGFKGAMLTCNEAKDQLFITGGDQTVNPKDFGIDHPHEVETLGEVVTIEYFTDKHHLGSEGGTATYTHKFRSTNENGKHVTVRTARNPDLIYHKRDKHLEFSGGSYLIRKEGIDL